MAEYIDLEKLLQNVCRCAGFEKGCSKDKCSLWKAPAADVAPVVHARWIAQDETFTRFMCSHCNSKNHRGGDNYCPNCGAKVDLKGGADERP